MTRRHPPVLGFRRGARPNGSKTLLRMLVNKKLRQCQYVAGFTAGREAAALPEIWCTCQLSEALLHKFEGPKISRRLGTPLRNMW
jgi:hypothetical protein